jgi:SAM-dependent methyltransferase
MRLQLPAIIERMTGPMVPQDNKRIKKTIVPELDADYEGYLRVVEDMVHNGGPLIPDPNWLIVDDHSYAPDAYDIGEAMAFAVSEKGYRERFSKMKALMKAWIGGTERPSRAVLSKYRRFMDHNDPLGLWQPNVEESEDNIPLLQADLGSIMDLNLLYAFAASSERKVTRILEVGGGYGRLAEAAFNIFGRSIKYVLVDAVPASLYYSSKYLSHACPDATIRSFYDDGTDDFDLQNVDIAIMPSWQFEKLNRSCYDICVNIESMQEMNQVHVDHYLSLFQSVAADGATIYLSNAHDYYFLGSFNYPKNWQKLLSCNTPRSWRSHHPTEIFRKTGADYSAQNSVVDSAYSYGLWLQKDPEDFISRNGYKPMIAPLLKGIVQTARSTLGVRTRLQRYFGRSAKT